MMLAAYDLDPTLPTNFVHHTRLMKPQLKILSDKEFFGNSINPNLKPKIKADFITQKALIIAQTKPQFLTQLQDYNLLNLYKKLDLPLAICLFHIEQNGLLVDQKILQSQLDIVHRKMRLLEQKVQSIIPKNIKNQQLNLNSPQQLQQLLFDELRLPDNFKGSTNHLALSALITQHPIIRLILQYRNFDK